MGATAFDLIAKLTLDSAEYDKGLDDAESKASGIGGKLGSALGGAAKIGAAAIGAASAAVGAFAKSSIDAGLTFDASMSNVAAISGATGDDFDALRKKAQEMGASTKFTATEAADAMSYMAMAGWKTGDMLDGIEGIMNLAAASGEDLALTSDIVTDALTAFGMTAEDSGRFADILASAASNANTNVAMMGDTFKYVAPVAGALGYGAEDVAVAIGLMANSGIKGSQAGTALRGILTRLAKPTKESSTAMEALGLSLDDGNGRMYSFMEVMEQMRDGFKDKLQIPSGEVQSALYDLDAQLEKGTLTQKQYDKEVETLMNRAYGAEGALMAQYAAMLAGQEGMSGLLAIVNASDKDFKDLAESIDNSSQTFVKTADGSIMPMNEALEQGLEIIDEFNGTAEVMAEKMQDNLSGSVTRFKSALEGVQIAISDFLSPTLREFVDIATLGIGDVADALREGDFEGAMEIVGNTLSGFIQKVVEILPKVMESAAQVLGAFAQGIMQNLPTLMESATQMIVMFAQYLIQGIPQFIITAIQIVQSLAQGIIDALPELVPAAINAIASIASALVDNIGSLVDSCVQIVTAIGQYITENASFLAMAAVAVIVTLADAVIDALPDLIPAAIEAVIALAEAIIDHVDALIDAAIEIIIALTDAIIDNLPTLLEKAPEIIRKLSDAIIRNAVKLIDAGTTIIAKLAAFIIQNFPKIVEVAAQLITEFVGGIANVAWKVWNAGEDIVRKVWDGIKSLNPMDWGRDLINGFISGIGQGIDGLRQTAANIAGTVRDYIGFSEPDKGPLSNFHTYAPDMMRLFAQGIADNEKLIEDQLKSSFDFENELSPNFGLRRETSSITMNVYGAKGQDVNELADIVMKKLTWKTQQDRRAWA